MSNEKTQYIENTVRTTDENTVRNDNRGNNQNQAKPEVVVNVRNQERPKGTSTARKVAVGTGMGLVLGTVSSFLAANAHNTTPTVDIDDPNQTFDEPEDIDTFAEEPQPEWADESVSVATSVTDNMSFSEAFATARAEVGPGGAFVWNGNVYGTYYAEEWDNMSAEEKAEYNNKFDWSKIEPIEEDNEEPIYLEDDDEEFVFVESEENEEYYEYDDNEEEVEIEVVGYEYDSESDMSYATLTVDGEEVLLIDYDNDETFDFFVQDTNYDEEIAEDEIIDISGEGLTADMVLGTEESYDDFDSIDPCEEYDEI